LKKVETTTKEESEMVQKGGIFHELVELIQRTALRKSGMCFCYF